MLIGMIMDDIFNENLVQKWERFLENNYKQFKLMPPKKSSEVSSFRKNIEDGNINQIRMRIVSRIGKYAMDYFPEVFEGTNDYDWLSKSSYEVTI